MAGRGSGALLDMIDALLVIEEGDAARLSEMRRRLADGGTVYDGDWAYVEAQFRRLGRESPAGAGAGGPPRQGAGGPPRQGAGGPPRQGAGGPPRQGAGGPPGPPRPRSSMAWYLLPIFLWLLGGAIAWACLRNKDPPRARKTLVLGAALLAACIAAVVGLALLTSAEDARERPPEDAGGLSADEIKRGGAAIPYESLMAGGEAHAGSIVHFKGRINQVEKHLHGDAYMIRIGTQYGDFGTATDDVIAHYEPDSEDVAEWLDELDREGLLIADDVVEVWGVSKGLADYETLFRGVRTVPEADALILERAAGGWGPDLPQRNQAGAGQGPAGREGGGGKAPLPPGPRL